MRNIASPRRLHSGSGFGAQVGKPRSNGLDSGDRDESHSMGGGTDRGISGIRVESVAA